MAEERVHRRLAAILIADVVGYSRLVEIDEEGTRAHLRSLLAEVFGPRIAADGGRIVKTIGDGILVEFPSAVDAVRGALGIQKDLIGRSADLPAERRMMFRVGINVGDVIVEGDDIHGDGVNVASRLEGLCQPGEVYVSGTVYDQVAGKLAASFEDLGERMVKNLTKPVRVYRAQTGSKTEPRRGPPAVHAPPPPDDKPSIAVLPFTSLGTGLEQEEFADGMTEDLITDLSKVSGLFVVARNSSFSFKGQAVDVREISRRLGVRYVLEGSLRKVGTRIRINAQLIDATSGGHVWADRYDGALEDIFELQEEVCAGVVSALSIQLTGAEHDRLHRVHTNNLEAYELFVRAKVTPYPPVPERIDAARGMFEQVIELDPEFAGGHAGVAFMLAFGAIWSHGDASAAIDRAEDLAHRAIDVDETFAWSHMALGIALLHRGRHDDAAAAAAEAIVRQPNDADAHAYLGLILGLGGRIAEAVVEVDQAIRLNPQFVHGPYLNVRAQTLFLGGDYEGAVRDIEQNVERQGPVGPPALCTAAASYRALGRTEEAAREARTMAARFPKFRLNNWNFFGLIRDAEVRDRIVGLMRSAGLPE